MSETAIIDDNNPNNEWGKHVIEIVLKQWKYQKTYVTRVGGNCHGFTIMETAIDNLYDDLVDTTDDPGEIALLNEAGEKMLCLDEDDLGEEWLKKMVVSCRIIGFEPPTLNQIRARNGAGPVPDGDKPYVALASDPA